MKVRALIFDFDGLILETEGPIFQSWQELYRQYQRELSFDQWATIIGTAENDFDPLIDLAAQIETPLDGKMVDPLRRQRELDLIAEQVVLPGVMDYLEGAKRLGLKVGLASSSSCGWVTSHLERLGLLDYFDCIKASDDVKRTKPDPELYMQALQAFDLRPGQAVAFEDSPNGIRAAKQAGLFVVAVPNELTRRLALDEADIQLDTLADLPLEELLRQMEVY